MSSPLSMLKKTRRSPLQDQRGRQKVPFRRNMLKEFQATLAAAPDGEESSPPPSDFELMSAMMRRINLLESTVRNQAQHIDHKDKRIAELEEKQRLLNKSDLDSTHDLSGRDTLERKCQQLQNQVSEMERFLSDYGLIWVGDDEISDSERPDVPVARSFHVNFDLVLQSIKELNILAGEGECFVQSTSTGAQLAKKDPIQLSLYSNGIVMFEGPFRSYKEPSTQRCIQDLLDGYFPSELQDRFPDGAPFEVRDRREEEFIPRPSGFPGEGQAIQKKKDKTSDAVSSQLHSNSIEQFLGRLPKVVVKAGRVIDIRDSVRAALQGSSDAQSSSSVIVVDTPALQVMKERLQTSGPERPSSCRDVITLKVKSEDGGRTYILKMCSSETMGHMRQHLDKHRGADVPGYDIISAYPQCCYDDDHQTLQSYGLTTNSTLLLREKKTL